MEFRVELTMAILAQALTAAFLIHPGPYTMAGFLFLGQPLFLLAGLLYLIKVLRELRERGLL